MAGTRKPMAVNLAVVDGGKHWTKAQIEQRKASELHLPKPKELKPPKWLSQEAKKLFRTYAKLLLAFPEGIVSELDTGTLARYCDCELAYAEASAQKGVWLDQCKQMRKQAMVNGNWSSVDSDKNYDKAEEQVDYWSGQMARFEKICRGCAADMGLTVTSRCRLVVPQVELAPEADPLEALRERFLNGGQAVGDG